MPSPITFKKAPLIELIAELRWIPGGSTPLLVPQQGPSPAAFIGGVRQEEFYTQLGGELYKSGFNRSERLFPAGFAFALYQPVCRFRSERKTDASVLYQVGYGIFSVHAVPPYHSWAKFVPFVRTGIEALLRTRPEADRDKSFSQISLRYIDFFNHQLMAGRDVSAFIGEVLGISTKLPLAVSKVAASDQLKSLFTKVVVPTGSGDLTMSVGDGQFNNEPGIILDNTVSVLQETGAEPDTIMRLFDSAYSVLHNVFIQLTRPIHELMQPETAANS